MLRLMHQTVVVGQAHPKTYMKHLRITTTQKSVLMFWTKLRVIIPAKGLQESGKKPCGSRAICSSPTSCLRLAAYVNYEDGRLHRFIRSEGKTIFYRSLRLWEKIEKLKRNFK